MMVRWLIALALGTGAVTACGGAPASAPGGATGADAKEPAGETAAEVEPSGPTPEWNALVDAQLVWARPDLKNYCLGDKVPLFLPQANSAGHEHVGVARKSGCSPLSTLPEGTSVCCPASLPVADNPNTGGGKSCEQAYLEYAPTEEQEEMKSSTDRQLGRVLNAGTYFAHCKVPNSTKLSICAAIQDGAAVGVTVGTTPYDPQIADCVAKSVRGLKFPKKPKLDIAKTSFE